MRRQLLAVAALAALSAAAPQCYYPDGSVPTDFNYVPCVGVKYSSCCIPNEGDICLSDGLCYFPDDKYTYRGACTDQSWKDPNCPNFCRGPKDNTSTWVTLESCEGTAYCCYKDPPGSCCKDASLIFHLSDVTDIPSPYPAAASYAQFASSTAASTATATTTSASAASSSASSTSTATASSGKSGKKTVIIIVAAVAVIIAILVGAGVVLFFIRKQKSKNSGLPGATPFAENPGLQPHVENPGLQPYVENAGLQPQQGYQYQDVHMKPYTNPNIHEAPPSPVPPAYSPHVQELASNPQARPAGHGGQHIYELGSY